MSDRAAGMDKFLEQMGLGDESSIPWPWPRSMTSGELDWFRHRWHRFEPMYGAYLSDGIQITGRRDGGVCTILAKRWNYDYSDSIGHEIPAWRQGDCWAVKNGAVIKIR